MKVHFIRHGESASNAAPGAMALPGDQGDRLTERGWEQAREAGKHLGDLGASRIVTSPLRRARETAEAMSESLGLPIDVLEPMHELRESDGFGELALEEQRLRRWSVWMAEHADDPDHSYRGGESFNEVIGRVEAVKAAFEEAGEENVLAVSHGIFLRFFLLHSVLGDSFGPAQAERTWQIGTLNCGHSVFQHGEAALANGYSKDRWRALTWMARPWDPA